jgi:hypothetical protein
LHCPDPTVQFIALSTSGDGMRADVTKEVASAAQSHNLKTVLLLGDQATREAYLNYMSCPALLGNFYDGDGDPSSIEAIDGSIGADDFSGVMKEGFRLKVFNLWVACQSYNDPLLASVQKDAKAKKYAAGISDLADGPSDDAAKCAMEAAIEGKPMTAASKDCYDQHDDSSDQWGFGGDGGDLFWQ